MIGPVPPSRLWGAEPPHRAEPAPRIRRNSLMQHGFAPREPTEAPSFGQTPRPLASLTCEIINTKDNILASGQSGGLVCLDNDQH